MEVTFWGVRGSIPCCGVEHRRVGGNTSCVSVRFGQTLVIFDAGTGLREMGHWLIENPTPIRQVHLFLSHAHYDHIIGFPFFAPIWDPSFEIHIYATTLAPFGGAQHFFDKTLFHPPFFPVAMDQLQARLLFYDIHDADTLMLPEAAQVSVFPLNHPGGASGFRLDAQGRSVCYVSDTEHLSNQEFDQNILGVIKDSDLVIYDASFTDEEYPHFVGWGHSTWQQGVRLCQQAKAARLAIYHHDPSHTDEVLEAIEIQAQAVFPGAFVARQDQRLTL